MLRLTRCLLFLLQETANEPTPARDSAPAPMKRPKERDMVTKKAKNAKVRSTKERSPNFFLGVRIQSPSLLARLQEIQENFCLQDPSIKYVQPH
jgi:hypothetical protein